MITIKTDHKWKNFLYRYDVPNKVLNDQFSHLSEDDANDGFICYHGHYYHLYDFMRYDGKDPVMGAYDGYASDGYFSGVLLKVSRDGEQYQIASFISK